MLYIATWYNNQWIYLSSDGIWTPNPANRQEWPTMLQAQNRMRRLREGRSPVNKHLIDYARIKDATVDMAEKIVDRSQAGD